MSNVRPDEERMPQVEICWVAIRKDEFDLWKGVLGEQTPEICWNAIREKGAIRKDGFDLWKGVLDEQTPEICWNAIREKGEFRIPSPMKEK